MSFCRLANHLRLACVFARSTWVIQQLHFEKLERNVDQENRVVGKDVFPPALIGVTFLSWSIVDVRSSDEMTQVDPLEARVEEVLHCKNVVDSLYDHVNPRIYLSETRRRRRALEYLYIIHKLPYQVFLFHRPR